MTAKWAVAALCAYEAGAIATGRVPAVTVLCGRYRLLGPALVLALAVHLHRTPRVVVVVPAGVPADAL
jgi:hypothetical protein